MSGMCAAPPNTGAEEDADDGDLPDLVDTDGDVESCSVDDYNDMPELVDVTSSEEDSLGPGEEEGNEGDGSGSGDDSDIPDLVQLSEDSSYDSSDEFGDAAGRRAYPPGAGHQPTTSHVLRPTRARRVRQRRPVRPNETSVPIAKKQSSGEQKRRNENRERRRRARQQQQQESPRTFETADWVSAAKQTDVDERERARREAGLGVEEPAEDVGKCARRSYNLGNKDCLIDASRHIITSDHQRLLIKCSEGCTVMYHIECWQDLRKDVQELNYKQLQKGGKSAGSAFKECPTDSCCGQVVEAVVEKGLKGCDFRKTIYEVPDDVRRELAKKVKKAAAGAVAQRRPEPPVGDKAKRRAHNPGAAPVVAAEPGQDHGSDDQLAAREEATANVVEERAEGDAAGPSSAPQFDPIDIAQGLGNVVLVERKKDDDNDYTQQAKARKSKPRAKVKQPKRAIHLTEFNEAAVGLRFNTLDDDMETHMRQDAFDHKPEPQPYRNTDTPLSSALEIVRHHPLDRAGKPMRDEDICEAIINLRVEQEGNEWGSWRSICFDNIVDDMFKGGPEGMLAALRELCGACGRAITIRVLSAVRLLAMEMASSDLAKEVAEELQGQNFFGNDLKIYVLGEFPADEVLHEHVHKDAAQTKPTKQNDSNLQTMLPASSTTSKRDNDLTSALASALVTESSSESVAEECTAESRGQEEAMGPEQMMPKGDGAVMQDHLDSRLAVLGSFGTFSDDQELGEQVKGMQKVQHGSTEPASGSVQAWRPRPQAKHDGAVDHHSQPANLTSTRSPGFEQQSGVRSDACVEWSLDATADACQDAVEFGSHDSANTQRAGKTDNSSRAKPVAEKVSRADFVVHEERRASSKQPRSVKDKSEGGARDQSTFGVVTGREHDGAEIPLNVREDVPAHLCDGTEEDNNSGGLDCGEGVDQRQGTISRGAATGKERATATLPSYTRSKPSSGSSIDAQAAPTRSVKMAKDVKQKPKTEERDRTQWGRPAEEKEAGGLETRNRHARAFETDNPSRYYLPMPPSEQPAQPGSMATGPATQRGPPMLQQEAVGAGHHLAAHPAGLPGSHYFPRFGQAPMPSETSAGPVYNIRPNQSPPPSPTHAQAPPPSASQYQFPPMGYSHQQSSESHNMGTPVLPGRQTSSSSNDVSDVGDDHGQQRKVHSAPPSGGQASSSSTDNCPGSVHDGQILAVAVSSHLGTTHCGDVEQSKNSAAQDPWFADSVHIVAWVRSQLPVSLEKGSTFTMKRGALRGGNLTSSTALFFCDVTRFDDMALEGVWKPLLASENHASTSITWERQLVREPLHFRKCSELKEIYWPYEVGQLKRLQGGSLHIAAPACYELMRLFSLPRPREDPRQGLDDREDAFYHAFSGKAVEPCAYNPDEPNAGLPLDTSGRDLDAHTSQAESTAVQPAYDQPAPAAATAFQQEKPEEAKPPNAPISRLFPFMGPAQLSTPAQASSHNGAHMTGTTQQPADEPVGPYMPFSACTTPATPATSGMLAPDLESMVNFMLPKEKGREPQLGR
eukprot:evm.model.scf_2343.1 EVM.evm.TU.scf_2343.1   scf_2343:1346-10286(+)